MRMIYQQEAMMVRLNEMSREELLEVVAMKDQIIKELREEIKNYQELIREMKKEQVK